MWNALSICAEGMAGLTLQQAVPLKSPGSLGNRAWLMTSCGTGSDMDTKNGCLGINLKHVNTKQWYSNSNVYIKATKSELNAENIPGN